MLAVTLFPSGMGDKLSRIELMAAPLSGRPFFRFRFRRERVCGQRGYRIMEENKQDWTDKVGKQVSTAFIALLAALFVYGYLGWLV
jgi:hypothetical protein